jgi:hypothetical protein
LPWQYRVKARKKFSRAQVEAAIRSIQSVCKRKPGEKSVVQEHLEERRTERDRENRWEPKSRSTG